MTGWGIAAKKADSLGKNASRIRIAPIGRAMLRLVAPVAMDRPTLLENVDWPSPPPIPAAVVHSAPASMPPETGFISVRFQSASLIFSHSVRSPTVFKIELTLAIRKGITRLQLTAAPP